MKRAELKALNIALKMQDVQSHINRKKAYWKMASKDIIYRWIIHWVSDRIKMRLIGMPLSKLLMIFDTFETVLVVTIKDDVVDEAVSFLNSANAEKYYKKTCLKYGADRQEMNNYLDDGYYAWANGSVCLVHPEGGIAV